MISLPSDRFELVKLEMSLLQNVFHKYDDMIFKSRNWFITLWIASIGLAFSSKIRLMFLVAIFISALYWTIEGLIRYQYWYKYVIRYRALRGAVNSESDCLAKISLYDLTDHYGKGHPTKTERFMQSFFKFEPAFLYFALAIAAGVLWFFVHLDGASHISNLPNTKLP